ncbi:MAG: hypothetical protein ABMA01_20570, partial [Chthoniobacteraceae bacterium]
MSKRAPDLIDALACEPVLAGRIRAVAKGADGVEFGHVAEGALSSLCAVIARSPARRLWLVCPTLAAQEQLHNELIQWFPDALFFPELEIAPVEGALPDPEAAADRVAIVQRLGEKEDPAHPLIIVLTKASLDDAVPDQAALRSLQLDLAQGQKLDRDALLRQLADAGYESAAQVSQRGQFAVRGGIVDVFSFQHPLPVRLEFFDDALESIRQFDLDAQTSVGQLPGCAILLGNATAGERRLRDCISEKDVTVDAGAGWLEAKVQIHSDGAGGDFTADATDAESDGACDVRAEAKGAASRGTGVPPVGAGQASSPAQSITSNATPAAGETPAA